MKLQNHCQNPTCYNLSKNYDMCGIFCSSECFLQHENPDEPRITRKALLEMMIDYKWEMSLDERRQAQSLGLYQDRLLRLKKDEEQVPQIKARAVCQEMNAVISEYSSCTDEELENLWQNTTSMIEGYIRKYFATSDETLREKAEAQQMKQSEIQKEITRRHQ